MKIIRTAQEAQVFAAQRRRAERAGADDGRAPSRTSGIDAHGAGSGRRGRRSGGEHFRQPAAIRTGRGLCEVSAAGKRDEDFCRQAGVDLLFRPSPEEMYFADASVTVEENSLSETLCGKSRPGHFRGVCTVVTKLFHLLDAGCGGLRGEGFSAACDHSPDGARSQFPDRDHRRCRPCAKRMGSPAVHATST